MELIAEGAEARIYNAGDRVIKERIPKAYRLKEIDDRLRKFRTRREAKVFVELEKLGLNVPRLLSFSDKSMTIEMEFVEGQKLRDVLSRDNCLSFGSQIGAMIGVIHKNDIIHADLTTSNMIVRSGKICLIDFGLSFFSIKSEDKAVDLHLLRQTLESAHNAFWNDCYVAVIEAYKKSNPGFKAVLDRLEKVEARGRYKGKGLT